MHAGAVSGPRLVSLPAIGIWRSAVAQRQPLRVLGPGACSRKVVHAGAVSGPRLAAAIQQDLAGSESAETAALRARVRELELDAQLMQRDVEELSVQASDALAALRCALPCTVGDELDPSWCSATWRSSACRPATPWRADPAR